MPQASPSNHLPPSGDTPLLGEPFVEQVQDEPITFFTSDFWGQLLPLAIVLSFVAATVTMSAPEPTEPPAEFPAAEELQLTPAQGLSHGQLDSQATPELTEILAQMPAE